MTDDAEVDEALLDLFRRYADGAIDSDEFNEEFDGSLQQEYERVTLRLASREADQLEDDATRIAVRAATCDASFKAEHRAIWRRPSELFVAHVETADELLVAFNEDHEQFAIAGSDSVFFVLRLLAARAVRTAREIHTLLAAGFGDGAFARWRTLHEVAVVATFIGMHGDDDLADRYLDHVAFHDERDAKSLREEFPDQQRVSDDDYDEMVAEIDGLKQEHSDHYDSDYGWAVPPLIGRPNLTDLMRFTDMSGWKPVTKVAHHQVHADAWSALAILRDGPGGVEVLNGPSYEGLAEPAGNALRSLTYAVVAYLVGDHQGTARPELVAKMGALGHLAIRASEEFQRVESALHDHQ